MDRRRRGLVWWRSALPCLCLCLGACPRPPIRTGPVEHRGPALTVAGADDLLKRVQESNDGYGTLETVQRVTIEIALGEGRSEKRSFRALLAVRRPGLFRVNLLGPAGLRLMDLLYDSGRPQLLQLHQELARSSRLAELTGDIAGDIAAVFRLDPQPTPGRRTLEETVALASGQAPLFELREYRGEELLRQLTIFAASLAISRQELNDGKGGVRTITYGDYERQGGVLVPRRIHLAREGGVFYWLSIEVESVTIDPKLDDRLFKAAEDPSSREPD